MQVVEAKPYDQLDGTFYKAKITHVRWARRSIIGVSFVRGNFGGSSGKLNVFLFFAREASGGGWNSLAKRAVCARVKKNRDKP